MAIAIELIIFINMGMLFKFKKVGEWHFWCLIVKNIYRTEILGANLVKFKMPANDQNRARVEKAHRTVGDGPHVQMQTNIYKNHQANAILDDLPWQTNKISPVNCRKNVEVKCGVYINEEISIQNFLYYNFFKDLQT